MRTKWGVQRDSRPLGEYPHRALMIAVIQQAIRDDGIGAVREPCVRRWCEMADMDPDYLWRLGQRVAGTDVPYVALQECGHRTWRELEPKRGKADE